MAESDSLSYLLKWSPPGSQLHHAQGHGHAQRGENDVVLTPCCLQPLVQSDWELWCSVLWNVRRTATVARQQDGEEEERGQNVQDQHRSTDHRELSERGRVCSGLKEKERWEIYYEDWENGGIRGARKKEKRRREAIKLNNMFEI